MARSSPYSSPSRVAATFLDGISKSPRMHDRLRAVIVRYRLVWR